MSYNPKPLKRGDPIRADDRNAMNAQLRRLAGVRGGPGLVVRDGGGGLQVSRVRPEEIYLQITGAANGDGGYPWVQAYPAAGGTWTVSGRTGSASVDPAYDRFGSTTLPAGATPYRARRSPTSGAWIFRQASTACVADAVSFCACGCLTRFPKTLFIGDDTGTHALVGGFSASVGGIWTTLTIANTTTTTYCSSGQVDCLQGGPHLNDTPRYFYRLTFRCAAGGGDPAGWKLEVVFGVAACADGIVRLLWSNCVTGSPNFSLASFLPLNCAYDGLGFSLPTMLTGGATPTPGGGGSLTVVA